jgi:hypothetical protein
MWFRLRKPAVVTCEAELSAETPRGPTDQPYDGYIGLAHDTQKISS